MAGLRQRFNRWEAKVRIPDGLRQAHDGRAYLYRTLEAPTRQGAKAEADAWEAGLRLDWAERNGHAVSPTARRALYQRTRDEAVAGRYVLHVNGRDDPIGEGIDHEIDQIADAVGDDSEPSPMQEARLFALQDARKDLVGAPVKPRRELEPAFSEVAASYMKWWKAQAGLKVSNTEQQKRATYRLFSGYLKDRPIREVRDKDAAGFMDALRCTDPNYARSPDARELTWGQLQDRFGDRPKGLSASTLNRHAAALKALWDWAVRREHCEGLNPFDGFRTRLRRGINVNGYLAWDAEELARLLSPPPKRTDVHEVMLVAMHSGMRLNEIAALRWRDIREQDGVPYFDVTDAKSLAGVRQVPVHSALEWLLKRTRGATSARLWPAFNPEGPGKKPGADAGKEFSRFKQDRGFASRQKAFHSFRKNVVGQWERLGVAQSEAAEVVGHEKTGLTYAVYGAGIPLKRKAEMVEMLVYPGLHLSPAP